MSDKRPQAVPPELVNLITEAVLQVVGGPVAGVVAPAGGPGLAPDAGPRLSWVLGAPCGHLPILGREMAVVERLGYRQLVLDGAGAAASGMLPAGVDVLPLPATASAQSELLAQAAGWDMTYVGSLSWGQARALEAREDSDPVSALLLDRLLAGGRPRLLVAPELSGLQRSVERGTPQSGALPQDASRQRRALAQLGLEPLALQRLRRPLSAAVAAQSTQGKIYGGLLTEADVQAAYDEGHRQLELPPQTRVTPLADDKVRELGMRLRKN